MMYVVIHYLKFPRRNFPTNMRKICNLRDKPSTEFPPLATKEASSHLGVFVGKRNGVWQESWCRPRGCQGHAPARSTRACSSGRPATSPLKVGASLHGRRAGSLSSEQDHHQPGSEELCFLLPQQDSEQIHQVNIPDNSKVTFGSQSL